MIRVSDTLTFLFTVISVVTSTWTTSHEGREKVIQCFDDMNRHGDITNLLLDVTTPESIDVFCRRQSDLQRCVSSNEHYLNVAENTEYLQKTSGVHKFYLNVCPPGTDITQEYKGNSPCFQLIKNEILSCGSDLPDLNSYKMKTSAFHRCCALRAHRNCLKKVTGEKCGADAAEVVEKIHTRYFESVTKDCYEISCVDDANSTPEDATRRADNSFKKWNFSVSRNPDHHSSHRGHWESTTTAYERRTLPEDRTGTANADTWKKHKKHNAAIAISASSVFSIISCLATFLVFNVNKI